MANTTLTRRRGNSNDPASSESMRRRGNPHQREDSVSRDSLPLSSVPRYLSVDPARSYSAMDYSSWSYIQDPTQNSSVQTFTAQPIEAQPTTDANPLASTGDSRESGGEAGNQTANPDNATPSESGASAAGGNMSTGGAMLEGESLQCTPEGNANQSSTSTDNDGLVQQQRPPSDDDKQTPLPEAVIARTGYIVAPRVPAPPKEALKRSGEIRKRTGSPPEMHHAKVQQTVLRIVDAARDGQRQIVWRTGNLAKDTHLSLYQMADQIMSFVSSCVRRVKDAVQSAKGDLTQAVDAQLEHLSTHTNLTGEALTESRKSSQQDVHDELFRNQEQLSTYHTELQQEFTPYLLEAQTNVMDINKNGEAFHIVPPAYGKNPPPVPEGQPNSSTVPPGPRKSLKKAQKELTTKVASMAGSNALGFYHADRITPVLEAQHQQTKTNIESSLMTQARSLDSFRGQFTNYALRLTTPMAQGFAEQRQRQRENLEYQIEDDRHQLADSVGEHGNTLIDKFDGVIKHLDKELEPKLVEGLQSAGRKAAKGFREQGDMTQRMMENTAASLALAYPELVARVAQLLPPGKFLNHDELAPQLKAAWESARRLPDQQYAAMADQAAQTLEQANRAKHKQMDALGESTSKSLQQIGDVVTATRFDFDLFGFQVTGQMREGGWASVRNAREYAERMARQILDTRGDADGALANLLRSFCGSLNNAIDNAGQGYFTAVTRYEESMTSGQGSVFKRIQKEIDDDLSTRSKTLHDELTKPDTATTTGLVVLNVLTLGATTPLTVGYLVYSDADDDEVFAAFGDLQWPGQPALAYYFDKIGHYGDLLGRFDECLSETQARRARNLFSQSAAVRGAARESALRDTLTVTGMNSFARESLVKGFHSSERAALGPERVDQLVADLSSGWTTWFVRSTTVRMNEGYIRGDLGMVLSARMDASLQRARGRSSDHIYQSVHSIEQLARTELARTQSGQFITDDQIQQLTDAAMMDFATHHRRIGDALKPNDIHTAREIFIREATDPIRVQRPAHGGRGHHGGYGRHGGHHGPPQRVPVAEGVRRYVEQVVRGGWKSEDALTAEQAYEFSRASRGSRPSRADQVRFTRTFQDQELNRVERELREHPERRDQLMPELLRLRQRQEQRMLRLAQQLEPPATAEQIEAAGGATQYMAQRTARLFSGGEDYQTGLSSGTNRSEEQENAQFGYELITQGRASLTAGVRLATRDTGTNDELLRMTFQGRSKAEVAQTRADWQSRYGESMDAMLGIGRHRGMSGGEFALGLVINPAATLILGSRGEISGDLANDIEALARGTPETDQDYIELSALRYQQQRRGGTGFLSRITMSDTTEARSIDGEQRAMAEELLAEARRQRALRLREPGTAIEDFPLPDTPEGVFQSGGNINPDIASLVFQRQQIGDRKTEPRYTGNRDALLTLSTRVEQAATRYQMEIDRQERLWLAGITVLAIAATLILMAFGVGFVLASVIVALGAGLLTIAVKSGMRGQRYGWEEAATDMANTAIEVAAAGAGGAIAGGLGKSGMVVGRLARFGEGLTKTFGRVGGAVAREAIVGAASSAAQTAIQDGTYDDGPGTAFGRIMLGGLKGASIGAVSAGVSEGISNRLNRSLVGSLDDVANTSRLARLGAGMGPTGRNMLKEGISEGLGGIAGEAAGIYIEIASGQYKGSLGDALQRMGQAGLKDMIRSGGRAGISSRHRSRYNQLMAAARDNPNLSRQDLQALRAASVAAGEPPRSLDDIRQQVIMDRQNLSLLPPGMQRLAQGMDSESLKGLTQMLHGGELGKAGSNRLDLFVGISEKNPDMDFASLRQQMEANTRRMASGEDETQAQRDAQQPLRNQITADLPAPVRDALSDIPLRGLEYLPASELPKVARMLAAGTLTPRQAEALVRSARQQNPDLDAVGFLKNLNSAVQSARMATDAHTRILAKQRAQVLRDIPDDAIGVFARLPDETISSVRAILDEGQMPSHQRQDELFRQAQAINPSLDRNQFRQSLQQAVNNASQRQQQQRIADRETRQQHMTNVPKHLRSTLSVLPEAALVELHLRQMEGSISPAERRALQQAALRENPDLDLKTFNKALNDAIEQGTPIRPSAEQHQQLRSQLQASVPADQRAKVANVPILIMPDAAFAHYARSASGNAVTVILHGKPVVILRQRANPRVLREEGIHALQAQDPKWAKHIGSLDEAHLARWDDLPLDMQMALYRNKLELEIDAHDRMVDDLGNQLVRSDDPVQQARLRLELELAQRTLQNLENRLQEVDGITPLQRLQMRAGVEAKPQWLMQPARLFNKAKDDIEALLKQGVDDKNADARRAIKHLQGLEDGEVRALLALGLNAQQLRRVLKSGGKDIDATHHNVRTLLDLAQRLPAANRSDIVTLLMAKRDFLSLLPTLSSTSKLFGDDADSALKAVTAVLTLNHHHQEQAAALHSLLQRGNAEQRKAIAELLDNLGPDSRNSLIQQTRDLLDALTASQPSPQRDRVLQHVMDGFVIRDASDHVRDLRGAMRAIARSGSLSDTLIKQFAQSLQDNHVLSKVDSYALHLDTKLKEWKQFSTDSATKPFAELIQDVLPGLPLRQQAALADLHPWFKTIVASDEFKQRMARSGNDATQEQRALLQELYSEGLRRGQDLSSPDTLRRIMSGARHLAAETLSTPDLNALVTKELARMKVDPSALREVDHHVAPEVHLENLIRQRIVYQRMVDLAESYAKQRFPNWAKDHNSRAEMREYANSLQAGLKQKVTETIGEISATQAIMNDPRYRGMALVRGFEAGTGFDQVWVRRDANGNITDILIVEAKGPGASLGDPDKGQQMGHEWVAKTAAEMIMRGDDGIGTLIHDAIRSGQPPISGVVIQARDQAGNPGPIQRAPGTQGKQFRYNMDQLRQHHPIKDQAPETVAARVRARIAEQSPDTHELRYSNDEIHSIVVRCREIGLSESQIDALLLRAAQRSGPISASTLQRQLDVLAAIVRARGFPFRFNSINEMLQNRSKAVEPDMHAKDITDGIVRQGQYPKNTLTFNLQEHISGNGQIKEIDSLKGVHGMRMFVIDSQGNVLIGKRDPNGLIRMPHPTLIGGKEPVILAAGMIEFSKGRIVSVNNASGHYKPQASTLQTAEQILRGILPASSFSPKFKGFIPVEGS